MNAKHIYTFLIIVGVVVFLTGAINFLQEEGFKPIPLAGGFILIVAGVNGLKKSNKKNSRQ